RAERAPGADDEGSQEFLEYDVRGSAEGTAGPLPETSLAGRSLDGDAYGANDQTKNVKQTFLVLRFQFPKQRFVSPRRVVAVGRQCGHEQHEPDARRRVDLRQVGREAALSDQQL